MTFFQLERLVLKRGGVLRAPGCDAALDLALALLKVISSDSTPIETRDEILSHVHSTITRLEELCANQLYRGSQQKLYDLIEHCSNQRPERSVAGLIDYRAMAIYPAKKTWLKRLRDLLERHFVQDRRDGVRIMALNVLLDKFKANRHMYEDELVDKALWPYLKNLDAETSYRVKMEGIRVSRIF